MGVKLTRKSGPVSAAKLKEILRDLDGVRGKAGWFESAKYEDGTPVAYVAAIQEFGSSINNIPPRPFMRPTANSCRGIWMDIARSGSKAVMEGRATPAQVMEGLGLRAAGDIAKTITRITAPPLKPATVAARRRRSASGNASSKPLMDTKHMFDTITHVVENTK